jgi:membrane peptidoglycan carboxypeptidase
MMFIKTRVIHALLFFAFAALTAYLHHDAEAVVARRQGTILDYRDIVDLAVYDQPLSVVNGTRAADIEKHLRNSNFGECEERAKADLAQMPPRTICRRADILAVKSFAPFDDYIFEIERKSDRIRAIKTMTATVVEARLPSPVFSAVNIDDKGNIVERVRYDLLLGKEVDMNSLAIRFFVQIEDQRFFEHRGNDWRGIARALYRGFLILFRLSNDEPLQGGSSITEQTAKLIFLPEGNKISRRLKALFLAESLEQRFSKRQILELWLNLTVMGRERPDESLAGLRFAQRQETVRGFKTAARVLFNKSLGQCSPSELAILAILPRHPYIFPSLRKDVELDVSGNQNHRKLEKRRRMALEAYALALEGSGQKEAAERFRAALNVTVRFAFHEDDLKGDEALITFLERDLKTQFASLHSPSTNQGKERIEHGHILVLTTVDREFQRALSQQVEKELPEIKSKLVKLSGATSEQNAKEGHAQDGFSFEVQVDVVALSAEDGELRALSSLKTNGNRVMPNRANVNPPSFVASCAKPLIVAHALGEGVVTLQTPIRASDCAAPNGFRFEGPADNRLLPLSDHLIASRNAPFICVGNRLGIENVLAKWRELFPESNLPGQGFVPDPYQIMRGLNRPEAEVPPTAVAEAYTALARQGQRQSLRVVESMYVNGKKLSLSVPAGRQIFKPEAAVLTASLLRAGTKGLTQWQPTAGFDLALKTGSSSNTYWVVMFAPRLVLVVRYLVIPNKKLVDERAASEFSEEVSRRFETVFAGNVVKPFADSILAVIKQKRRGWLRGTFTHQNIIALRIDPVRQCVTQDDSGILAEYIRGTEPAPCPVEDVSEESAYP